MKEATARIKINKLLEAAGWRFFPEPGRPANIKLEHTTTLTPAHLDSLGEDFEKASKGFIVPFERVAALVIWREGRCWLTCGRNYQESA